MLQENKARQIFWKRTSLNLLLPLPYQEVRNVRFSENVTCLFSCNTHLRFVLLPYHRRLHNRSHLASGKMHDVHNMIKNCTPSWMRRFCWNWKTKFSFWARKFYFFDKCDFSFVKTTAQVNDFKITICLNILLCLNILPYWDTTD